MMYARNVLVFHRGPDKNNSILLKHSTLSDILN